VEKGGKEYLYRLRDDYNATDKRAELIKLSGVGPKVADCVCLYCMDCYNYVPLDTHML
jgi:N-glycosylase/DNA lyase